MKERRGVLVPFVANNNHLYLSFVLIGINNVYIVYISALDEPNATKRQQQRCFLDVQGKAYYGIIISANARMAIVCLICNMY